MKALIFSIIFAIVAAKIYLTVKVLIDPLPKPELDTNRYWGRSSDQANYKPSSEIKPFTVDYSQKIIDDLRSQLNRTWRYTEPLEGADFLYGFNSNGLQKVVKFWRDDYLPRWQERQTYLNSLPHFTTEIQGLRIHYIHHKPKKDLAQKSRKVIPLIVLHGWPSSVRELYDFIRILTEQEDNQGYVYEVVAPSLVGYGWSEAAHKTGFNVAEMAIVMRNLMLRLGFNEFLVQGGDWGSIIGSAMSTLFPENVIGYHSHMCMLMTPLALIKSAIASWFPEHYLPSRFFYEHHFPLMEKFKMLLVESGYFHIQATKPDTIGAVLTQNPIGLAAYILEKFLVVTGPGRNQNIKILDEVYTLDAVLDNVMIYYLTETSTSAARFYAEAMSTESRDLQLDRVQTPVPMGCARFKHDLPSALDWQLKDKYTNFIHSKYFNQGGHFASLEMPAMLYLDFAEFVAKINFNKD